MQILHFVPRVPLRLLHSRLKHHHLILDILIFILLHPQRRFDPQPDLHIILRDDTNRMARLPRTRRTSHTMDVRLAIRGEVVVKHDIDGRNIKTTRRNIGSDEDLTRSSTELVEGSQTRGLRQLAVQRDSAEAEGTQEDGEALRLVHSAGEDDGGLAGKVVEEIDEVSVLVGVGDEEIALEEGGDGLVLVGADLDAQRVAEGGALETLDFGGHGGREEVGAALTGEDFENFVEDGAEVEVEETVGFVHDEILKGAEREAFCVLQVVKETTGCRNDDMRLLA